MNLIIYKVIFKAQEQFENKNLTLSFKNLNFNNPLSISELSLLELKNLNEKNQQTIKFQNIEEVLIIGKPTVDYIFNYYFVLLFSTESDKRKMGYLIGNVKNLGDIIIGIWPFNINNNEITEEKILITYNDIIKNPENYSVICLISQ
ncbi:MAG: hypothetical protein ACFFC3_02375 [Candidatus Odinarchaeota archaeon]